MMNIRLSEGINTGAICDFINGCYQNGTNIRTFGIVRDNNLLAAAAIEPYSFSDKVLVYSLSKSFTSVCVGIAQSEGLLNIDERIIDIFPDKCPAVISENLSKMRIKDCLCMTSGHSVCCMNTITFTSDPIKSFLSQPVEHTPGTTFVYSTAATYICGSVIERRSGMLLIDYLYEKVLQKMDIEKPLWMRCADGSCKGGTGLIISGEDVTKFGIMLRDGGVFGGKRIVPEEWIKTASSIHSRAPENGTPDWTAGYGYQFWMNAREGYRGDGAYGQLCMILPKRNMVFTMLCESVNMQKEVELVYSLLDDIEKADNSRLDELTELTKTLYKPQKCLSSLQKTCFKLEKNIAAINTVTLERCEDSLTITLDCEYGTEKIVCGNGYYIKNSVFLQNLNPLIYTGYIYEQPEEISLFASFSTDENGIAVTLRHIGTPHVQVWTFPRGKTGEWRISLRTGTLNERIRRTSLVGC
ncbi:MAG: hypothetical protein CVU97_00150 [Firmicutes bacterium HGW-Firmicutes-21]|nr:MAG: hypothetical protein CVU97_00150 [Firmicutes bacterium HGW-Firmicutes-21]